MIMKTIGREVGPFRLMVQSDSMDVADMMKSLEEMAAQATKVMNDRSYVALVASDVPMLSGVTTPTDGIIRLLDGAWGLQPRTSGEILSALKANGLNYPITTISSILSSLQSQRRIRRWKDGKRYVHQKEPTK
jgi:hypothetical protein